MSLPAVIVILVLDVVPLAVVLFMLRRPTRSGVLAGGANLSADFASADAPRVVIAASAPPEFERPAVAEAAAVAVAPAIPNPATASAVVPEPGLPRTSHAAAPTGPAAPAGRAAPTDPAAPGDPAARGVRRVAPRRLLIGVGVGVGVLLAVALARR